MTHMRRQIHPVGQGAFYTESFRLDNGSQFNVVYDCGSYWDNKHRKPTQKFLDLIADAKQNMGGGVDVLFISHFHMDHINGVIELLRKSPRKPKVVLPQIKDNIKALYLVSAALKVGNDFANYQETIDIYRTFLDISSENRVLVTEEGESLDEQDIQEIRETIYSGQRLLFERKWMYVPVYHKSKEIDDLAENFAKQISAQINADGIITNVDETSWKEIVDVYKKVTKYNSGTENNVSLIVYSGPVNDAYVRCVDMPETITPFGGSYGPFIWDGDQYYRHIRHHHSGAIYVGDMEDGKAWEKVEEKLKPISDDIHHSVLHTIGLVQISHHGSWNEFNEKLANELSSSVAFCCFGSRNKYSHPSYLTIREFLQNGFVVVPVDEVGYELEFDIHIC